MGEGTVDELLQVFRDRGVEIQIGDEDVVIRFTKSSLLSAAQGITAQGVAVDTNMGGLINSGR